MKNFLLTVVALFLLVVGWRLYQGDSIWYEGEPDKDLGAISGRISLDPPGTLNVFEAFRATTTTATSSKVSIAGAKKVTLQISRQAHSSGSSQFGVYVSNNDPDVKDDYIKFAKLILNLSNEGNSNTYQLATTTTLTANGTSTISMDISYDAFNSMKCKVVETTDGQHSCYIWIER